MNIRTKSINKRSSFAPLFLTIALVVAAIAILPTASAKDLHYLVVDKSGSIRKNKLVDPLTTALKRHVNTLGEDAEVRIVFFDDRAEGREVWRSMTFDAKTDFGKHFSKRFKPGGKTRLYDTVGDVIKEVTSDSQDFSEITVMILSDGEDTASSPAKSWSAVEPFAGELLADNENTLITWYTLGFDPEDVPSQYIDVRAVATESLVDDPCVFLPPPEARFEAFPTRVQPGEDVKFIILHSAGDIGEVQWSFGDGSTAEGTVGERSTVQKSYPELGTYTIGLRVTGPCGEDATTVTNLIEVVEQVPVKAGFTWTPKRPRVEQTVQLTDKSSGNPTAYAWLLGDYGTSSEASPSFTPTSAGKVELRLEVTREGEVDMSSAMLEVLPPPPSAGFSLSPPEELMLGESLMITADSSEGTHNWTIDGRTHREGVRAEWKADVVGQVEILHTIEGAGGTAMARDKIYVRKPDVPDADFTITPAEVEIGESVTIASRKNEADWKHRWEIEGKVHDGATVTWTAKKPGIVEVVHVVAGPGGSSEPLTKSFVVKDPGKVKVAFSASPRKGKHPLEVEFKDKSEGDCIAYLWDFGDGATSTEQHPTHTYREAGEYKATLSVENTLREITVSPNPIMISVKAPAPAWIKWVLAGILGLIVLVVALKLLMPPKPGGTLHWEVDGKPARKDVTGRRFSLADLGISSWTDAAKYEIRATRDGRRYLVKDGVNELELKNNTNFFKADVEFKYVNVLL